MQSSKIKLTFVTGNAKKLEEFLKIVGTDLMEKYEIVNNGMDLDEL